eukprot:s8421_g2.t1
MDADLSDTSLRMVVDCLASAEEPTGDRRSELSGRYVLGAFCHGGQRGVTSLARRYPTLVRFLNKYLRSRLPETSGAVARSWSSILVLHAADVPVHRDYRNEWGTNNLILHVPPRLELWTGPFTTAKGAQTEVEPDWSSDRVRVIGQQAVSFDPRDYHALRRRQDWVIVGYSPLGIHKLVQKDKDYLEDLGFELPKPLEPDTAVKVVRLSSGYTPHQEETPSSSSAQASGANCTEMPGSSSQTPYGQFVSLESDIQEDTHTAFVGWDPSGGSGSNVQENNLEEAELYQFLKDRKVEGTYSQLTSVGVESPADLWFLFVEDLVEMGLSLEDTRRVMTGVHPTGTVRPDNPNMISLTTGEVCLFDRAQRQIPRVIQNRTLGYHAPGPPVRGLGVNTDGMAEQPDPYLEDWQELNGPPVEARPMPTEQQAPVYNDDQPGSSDCLPSVRSVSLDQPSSSSSPPSYGALAHLQHVQALDSDVFSQNAVWLQAVWDAETEEEFNALVNPGSYVYGPSSSSTHPHPNSSRRSPSVSCDAPEFQEEYSCKVVVSNTTMRSRTDHYSGSSSSSAPASHVLPPDGRAYAELGVPRIGVPIPPVVSLCTVADEAVRERRQLEARPEVDKVEEASFTPNVESLLEGLSGPLEVVHQVAPSEVRAHLSKWREPAQEEVSSMERMNAIVRYKGEEARRLLRRPGVEVIPAKGVFTVKPGKPYRRKVRVVSCGNFARTVSEEVLYASGAAAEVLRTTLIYAGVRRRPCWSTDIKCAFLLAPIPDTVQKTYVLRPPTILIALGICDEDEFWEVRRAVYGFKESPKWWSQYRDSELSQASFRTPMGEARLHQTSSDDNLWKITLSDGTIVGHVLVYVDDLLMLCNEDIAISLHTWIKSKWGCSDLERATPQRGLKFLGVDIHEVCDEFGTCGYALSQEGYIDELVRSHEVSECARSLVPLPKEWVKTMPEEEKEYQARVLRDAQRITGELLWISQRTRVDICYSVGLMSSWATRSPSFVIKIGLRVLAYLAGTRDMRLSLVPGDTNLLTIYTDASFAPFSERSISGIAVLMCNRCVIWKSRRQTLVSLSTAECELIAAIEGLVLGQSVEALIGELWGFPADKVLYVDNIAAITLAEGGGSQRTRHLRVRACYLREQIDRDQLRVLHCPGEIQLADALTKALPAPRLVNLNGMLGLGQQHNLDPAVQAVMTTSRVFRRIEPSDGQSVLLILALMMTQVIPAASQDDELVEGVNLDLYFVAAMLACTETGGCEEGD